MTAPTFRILLGLLDAAVAARSIKASISKHASIGSQIRSDRPKRLQLASGPRNWTVSASGIDNCATNGPVRKISTNIAKFNAGAHTKSRE
jgi:hypothetical protein